MNTLKDQNVAHFYEEWGKTCIHQDLNKVVAQHLQFQPEVRDVAEKILATLVAGRRNRRKGNSKLFYVGVHVRLVPTRQ